MNEMDEAVALLEQSFDLAVDRVGIEALSETFFTRFFATYPETQRYFVGTDLPYFRRKKLKIIVDFLVDIVRHPNYAEGQITQEVIRHQMYGLKDREYYFTLLACLQMAVQAALGDDWTPATEAAWNEITLVFRGLIARSADDFL